MEIFRKIYNIVFFFKTLEDRQRERNATLDKQRAETLQWYERIREQQLDNRAIIRMMSPQKSIR